MASRCAYKEGKRRCNRNGFGNPPLCRPHALQVSLDGREVPLTADSPFFGWLEAADRALSRSNVEIVQEVRGLFGEFLSSAAHKQATSQISPAPTPQEDPRVVLGFEPGVQLTAEVVKNRKRALAGLYHPDKPGGSVSAMKRVNEAADKLLCSL